MNMISQNILDEYNDLKLTISHHNHLYYDLDYTEIPDSEFDALMRRLKEIEAQHPEIVTKDSPTNNVGGVSITESKIKHDVPMLSIQDYFSKETLKHKFLLPILQEYPHAEFVVEQKIDGLSASAVYNGGYYIIGSTRGDGYVGDDITANLGYGHVKGIPETISHNPSLEVRGEVYMPYESFLKLNETREKTGEKLFANPRNAASGSLKLKDYEEVGKRGLHMLTFNIQKIEGRDFKTHSETLDYLKGLGFDVIRYKVCRTVDEVMNAINEIDKERKTLPYAIDGAVVKVNQLAYRDRMGSGNKTNYWEAAYKYEPEQKETIVRDIKVQVGRTGRLTPVAVFDPVELAGTTVTNATLHNQAQINRLNIGIGDSIIVQKAGEIIPEVVKVLHNKRPREVETFKLPESCPVCGEAVTYEDGEPVCTNPFCKAQLYRSVEYFGSKGCMDIQGLGTAIVQSLVDANYIKSLPDLYRLKNHRRELIRRNLIGREKTVDKLLTNIEASKNCQLHKFIKALGNKGIGEQAGKLLADQYKTIDAVSKARYSQLLQLNGIGDITAETIYKFFHSEAVRSLLREFKELGVNPVYDKENKAGTAYLKGLTLVVTGSLKKYSRTQIKEIIEKNGGKVVGTVSKKVNALIAGEGAGSKLGKAESLNIPIWNEETFERMIGNNNSRTL